MMTGTPKEQQLARRMWKSVALVCVAAWACGPASALESPADISGRWHGSRDELTRSKACAENDQSCNSLTLDVSRCGDAWCGVEVSQDGACGGIALKVTSKTSETDPTPRFEGALTLAKSTEPYVVNVSMDIYALGDKAPDPHLTIVGDTGGEFRFFRRSFPFSSFLSREGPVTCTPEKALSMLE